MHCDATLCYYYCSQTIDSVLLITTAYHCWSQGYCCYDEQGRLYRLLLLLQLVYVQVLTENEIEHLRWFSMARYLDYADAGAV